jgi:oxygen-independent coproporphyrinogen-3 oxidase
MNHLAARLRPYPEKCRLPFILYPPAMWTNPLGHEFAGRHLGLDRSAGDYVLYLSVPFCRVRCKACPYFIRTLSEDDDSGIEDDYVDALIADARRWAAYPRWRDGRLRSIYIGGGTGSILSTRNLRRMVEAVTSAFPGASDLSVTLEGNARDFDDEKLDYVAASPITRVSLGVQSFDTGVLRVVGSPHAAEDSRRVIAGLAGRGFRNVQLDLMYNLPGHNIEVWRRDLQALRDLQIEHFTIYLYRVHPGTAQDRLIRNGEVPPVLDPDSQYVTRMRGEAIASAAELGYRQYMFDHFARPGFESSYNHWTFKEAADALGLGAGAYSFINGYRTGTAKDVGKYVEAVQSGHHMITSVSHQMSDRVRKERYVIFAFQYWRLDFADYRNKFGSELLDDFGEVVTRLQDKGLVEVGTDRVVMTPLGQDWRMNVLLEFVNPAFWSDGAALEQPNWAMNVPMVELVSTSRDRWLGPTQAQL